MKKKCIVVAVSLAFAGANVAYADPTDDALKAMKKQIEELQAQIKKLEQKQAQPQAPSQAAPAGGGEFLQRKSGDGFTFFTRGGEAKIYGNLDLSIDTSTKGISGFTDTNGNPPFGNGGWMPAIATNLSYVGIRGFQKLGDMPFDFVYQLETAIDISATSGDVTTNSNTSNVVKGALTSRNSYIGLADPKTWGAVKIGKSLAPYYNSTSRMNPFAGMVGSYTVIMGNTGGDNRVEFGNRMDHAIWYESPKWSGFSFNVLASPGQNRASDNSNVAAGESDCAGGNIPGSGGLGVACNDGSFGTAYSGDMVYQNGGLYLTAAYELHKGVNRTSDLAVFDPNDVANEYAWKGGVQYEFKSTGTTIGGIWEAMRRDVPAYLTYQNERSRNGSWVVVSQGLGEKDSLHFGWAHAFKADGDPGQHPLPGLTPGTGVDNSANMYTLAWKHKVDRNFSYYVTYATTINAPFGHYDLGAGGHGVTTDCHDASNPLDVNTAAATATTAAFDPAAGGPRCWTGGHLQAVSVGMKYAF